MHCDVSTSVDPHLTDTVAKRGVKRSFGKAFKQDYEDVQMAASNTAGSASTSSAADVSGEPFEVRYLTDEDKQIWNFLDLGWTNF